MLPSEKKHVMARTLLHVWPEIPAYIEMLKNKQKMVAYSGYGNDGWCENGMSTEKIMNKIIDISVKINTLKNLDREIRCTIATLPERDRIVLEFYARHVGSRSVTTNLRKEGFAERSFYRDLDLAIDKLARRVENMGLNAWTWQNLLVNFGWIDEIRKRVCK